MNKSQAILREEPDFSLSAAEGGVGTGTAAVTVFGGCEAEIGREDSVGSLFKEGDETVSVDGNVGDGITTDDKRGVIAIGSGMLDEEQRWRDGLRLMLADDMAVEEGLEIVDTVVGNLGGIEDSLNVGHGTEMTGTGLVVDDADTFFATDRIGNAVKTVNNTTNLCISPRHVYALFEAEDGEGRQTAVGLDEQAYVFDDDLAVDELEAIEVVEPQCVTDGIVDGALDGDFIFEKVIEKD